MNDATQTRRTPRGSHATEVQRAKPAPQGWRTTDEEEIERRRQRGVQSTMTAEPLEAEHAIFGSFAVHSASDASYRVEIRSLSERLNSCDCPDYRVNGLGTCKHIETVLHRLRQEHGRGLDEAAAAGSPRVEIFVDRRDGRIRAVWPSSSHPRSRARLAIAPFFSADGTLLADPLTAVPALQRELAQARGELRAAVRLSHHIEAWLEPQRRQAQRVKARSAFLKDVAAGKRTLEVVDIPLYPYQREGMLHLAFTERALLADEMGLGKTVQAIAACELLRRLRGIERVLVVAPASLKAEWEEQIAKFTGLSSLIVQGPRANRLAQYRQRAFFYLTNYEQVRSDGRDIQSMLAPDVVILDEAQRIKNWQAKTAEAVKRLHSPYAFVLTGTPLENRIDEIYSIVQFLDPGLFGPLFRFNRDFYELDERGRPVGYRNLAELHRRLRPIMLRRRKEEVEGQLPGRTVNNYFVAMAPEQATRYDEYRERVARLLANARRRPLTPEELDRLQQYLACMRMICDTPYILDPECRVSPKLEELERILAELTEPADNKIIIFSEWERMLELVRELAQGMGLELAWHTGSVPQAHRRGEIRRFKDDPACRLFLSTDAGSVGLNLQVANIVINLDLPWNPAKLEQRIARAWRKHQRRAVQVINLVCEQSIEHRMVHMLEQKRALALGVVDGQGEVDALPMPSGRAAFVERLEGLMGQPPAPAAPPPAGDADPLEELREDAVARLTDRLDLLEVHDDGHGGRTVLAVVDRVDKAVETILGEALHGVQTGPGETRLEVLDRATYQTLQRLMRGGVIHQATQGTRTLHQSPIVGQERSGQEQQRFAEAQRRLAAAERSRRMADVLRAGGFAVEALSPLREALVGAHRALACILGGEGIDDLPPPALAARLVENDMAAPQAPLLLARLAQDSSPIGEDEAAALYASANAVFAHAQQTLERAAPR